MLECNLKIFEYCLNFFLLTEVDHRLDGEGHHPTLIPQVHARYVSSFSFTWTKFFKFGMFYGLVLCNFDRYPVDQRVGAQEGNAYSIWYNVFLLNISIDSFSFFGTFTVWFSWQVLICLRALVLCSFYIADVFFFFFNLQINPIIYSLK